MTGYLILVAVFVFFAVGVLIGMALERRDHRLDEERQRRLSLAIEDESRDDLMDLHDAVWDGPTSRSYISSHREEMS